MREGDFIKRGRECGGVGAHHFAGALIRYLRIGQVHGVGQFFGGAAGSVFFVDMVNLVQFKIVPRVHSGRLAHEFGEKIYAQADVGRIKNGNLFFFLHLEEEHFGQIGRAR